jgi:hypothetical protein
VLFVLHLLSFGAVVFLFHSSHPFKRNLEIPFSEVLGYISAERRGRTLLVTNEPVTGYLARSIVDCAIGAGWRRQGSCQVSDLGSFDTVIIGGDHNFSRARRLVALEGRVSETMRYANAREFGFDADAGVKTRLTGADLSSFLLRLTVYRRDGAKPDP